MMSSPIDQAMDRVEEQTTQFTSIEEHAQDPVTLEHPRAQIIFTEEHAHAATSEEQQTGSRPPGVRVDPVHATTSEEQQTQSQPSGVRIHDETDGNGTVAAVAAESGILYGTIRFKKKESHRRMSNYYRRREVILY